MVETGNTSVAAKEMQVRNTGENKGCCQRNANKKYRIYKCCRNRNTNKKFRKSKGCCKRNTKIAAKEIQIRNTKIAAKININNRYRQYKSGCYYCLSRLSHSLTEDQSEQCASSPS